MRKCLRASHAFRGSAREAASAFLWAVVIAVLFNPSRATGATLDVGGSGAYPSIQQAVDAAQPGDVLRIAGGNYYESIVIQKSLTILGGFNAAHTTRSLTSFATRVYPRITTESIAILRRGRGLLAGGGSDLWLQPGQLMMQGESIRRIELAVPVQEGTLVALDSTDGITTGEAWLVHPHDAVFRISDQATSGSLRNDAPLVVRFDGLRIACGRADPASGASVDSGGGIHVTCGRRTSFTLTRSEMVYNSAVRSGGAISIVMTELATCLLSSNSLTRNECTGSSQSVGGAVSARLAQACDLSLIANQIAENRSAGQAGGVGLEALSGCYVDLHDNVLTSNTAQEIAGAVAARLSLAALFRSSGNQIEHNQSVGDSCGGAYVELQAGSYAWLVGDRIAGNRAALSCGGVGIWADGESRCEFAGGRVSDNEASECGGMRLALLGSSVMAITASEVKSNRATAGRTGGLEAEAGESSEVRMTSTTIAANWATGDCGGIRLAANDSSSFSLGQCNVVLNEARGRCGGGRMEARDISTFELEDSVFSSNRTPDVGGAMDCRLEARATLVMRDCRFESNEAGRRNGVGSLEAAGESLATVVRCDFQDNHAGEGGNGFGQMEFTAGSSARFEGCAFLGNRSEGDYGMGRVSFTQESWGEFSNCVFRDNVTSGSGGVGFFQAADEGAIVVRGCLIARNEARQGSYGALCVEDYFGAWLVIEDTVFEDNESSGAFGALYVYGDEGAVVSLSDCQFVGNRALNAGHGACAIEVQRFTQVSIAGTTVSDCLSYGDHAGLYISASNRSPVSLFDCRLNRNVASAGDCGALTILADGQSTVSLVEVDCRGNRAYGNAGAVSIKSRDNSSVIVEDCDWYRNIAWREENEPVRLEEHGGGWHIIPSGNTPDEWLTPLEPGDLITQGSASWAISTVRTDGTSTVAQLRGPGLARSGDALLRRITGDGGAMLSVRWAWWSPDW